MLETNTIVQGRYCIIRQLDKGGMGLVYLAKDENLGITVALKQNLLENEPSLIKAFKREAQLLAGLDHSALPKVKDYFISDAGQFLVMDYIIGDNLATVLEKRRHKMIPIGEPKPFEVGEVVHWAEGLLDALDYLHTLSEPVIHRDIKPQNLKLAKRNQIILLDFGLAKGNLQSMTRVTTSGSLRGYTPIYAPLEQIQGLGTDPRSDLYALGATLYHLITGTPPVGAATRAEAFLGGEPDPLRAANEVNPKVPREIATVLMKAMEQHRNKRPASAAEMLEILSKAKLSTVVAPQTEPSRDTVVITDQQDPWPSTLPDPRQQEARAVPAARAETESNSQQEETQLRKRETDKALRQQQEQKERDLKALRKKRLLKIVIGMALVGLIILAVIIIAKPPAGRPVLVATEFQIKPASGSGPTGQGGEAIDPLTKLLNSFVQIAPGEVEMGSERGEVDERPPHPVRISQSFEMGECEVTQAQWQAVMGNNPSVFKDCGGNCPVENVSWDDAQAFIKELNARNDGYQYRLPSEAEWEYACRAGTAGDYAGDLGKVAWYEANSNGKTHPVRTKEKNAWGLYDMHGNVLEWVQDWFSSGYYRQSPKVDPTGPAKGRKRVFRGGCWGVPAQQCRPTYRNQYSPTDRYNYLGLRLVRTPR
jgi:formylglycine-generating enzyme required for sulfatase activity